MPKGRFEAFSDGVIAILITIMVLELRTPQGKTWPALKDDVPVLLAYLLSFVLLGIYWNNHHHMVAVVARVSGGALWANLHLLFWLSLVPFATAWMSENNYARTPVAAYGIVLLGAAIAYFVLQSVLLRIEGPDSPLGQAIGRDRKGKTTLAINVAGIGLSFLNGWIGIAAYVVVALVWLVPDRRIERRMSAPDH
ncbi:MAG TPA: TMEM175 family protein [Streptosporangiaceae bacterium]